MRKSVVVFLILLLVSGFIWMPMVVFAVEGNPDKFQYYVQALEYMLKAFIELLKAILELFKEAVG
jgi:hypothetical protein